MIRSFSKWEIHYDWGIETGNILGCCWRSFSNPISNLGSSQQSLGLPQVGFAFW